jgi:FRG domain
MNAIKTNYLNDEQVHKVETWKEFQEITASSKYRRWAFRGQRKSDYLLTSTLTRYLQDYKIRRASWHIQEARIIRIFRRKASLFLQHVPKEDDIFHWLAMMQHHGAPTRLLDFTWSPFVAAFFALEKARSDCAIWAVNFHLLKEKKYFFEQENMTMKAPRPEKGIDHYLEFYTENSVPFITAGEPYSMTQRQIAQSGTFLVPGILDKPIEGILSNESSPENLVVKFILDAKKIRDEAMESLYYMNITNATLFPGLEGLARSLGYELEFHWAYNPRTGEKYMDDESY